MDACGLPCLLDRPSRARSLEVGAWPRGGVCRSTPSGGRSTRLPGWLSGITSESAGALPSDRRWREQCGGAERREERQDSGAINWTLFCTHRHRSPHPPTSLLLSLSGRTSFGCCCKTRIPASHHVRIRLHLRAAAPTPVLMEAGLHEITQRPFISAMRRRDLSTRDGGATATAAAASASVAVSGDGQ